MIEAFNIMQDRLTRTRLAGDPPDVQITRHIGHIGWLDFHRAEEAIAAGKAATETALEPIEATIAALA
jgi:NTE family protein